MPIIKNQIGGHVGTLDTANVSYQITDLASPNTSFETVTGMGIARLLWTGDWKITQGNTTLFQTGANTSGVWDISSEGIVLMNPSDNSANLVANTAGSTSTLVMVLTKYATNLGI